MRRKGIFLSVLLLIVLTAAPSCFGQLFSDRSLPKLPPNPALAAPDVVTVWQKLGLPQGVARFKKFRDSRINRDGLSPGKERTPKLKAIADPANLAEGAPEMLKVAAQMKIDADLAPQKIKALQYICSVGCSCYNKQTAGLVEKALLEGMKDCTLEVRLMAMQVVINNAGNKCSDQGQCGTCCSEGVVKALEEIAFKQDKTGCYIEPNAQVRSMAEQALNACPKLVEEKKPIIVPLTDKPDLTDKGEEKTDEEKKKEEERKQKLNDDGTFQNDDSASNRRTWNLNRQATQANSYGTAWADPSLSELNIRGVIKAVRGQDSHVSVQLMQPLELPVGAQLVFASDENNVSFGNIVASNSGQASVRVEDFRVVQNLRTQQRIRLGVLE